MCLVGRETDKVEIAKEDVATYDNDGYYLHLPFNNQI
jgi:hypothetical protein